MIAGEGMGGLWEEGAGRSSGEDGGVGGQGMGAVGGGGVAGVDWWVKVTKRGGGGQEGSEMLALIT